MTYGSRSLLIPIDSGSLSRGTWQGFYLCDWTEHWSASHPQPFTVAVTLMLSANARVSISKFIPPARGFHSMVPIMEKLLSSNNADAPIPDGLACMMVRHCSASMAYVEDKRAVPLLEYALSIVVPDKWSGKFFQHTYEGWDDMPGHAKNALIGGPCVLVPITAGGKLLIAGNEDIALGEHRDDWGSGGRGVSVTKFPGCFRGTDGLSFKIGDGAKGVEIPVSSVKPKIKAGLAILKGPAGSCFIVAPANKLEQDFWERMVQQKRTSDEFLYHKWSGMPSLPIGDTIRSIIFGGGHSRIVPVRDGVLWLPHGCSVYLISTSVNGLQCKEVSVDINWFGLAV